MRFFNYAITFAVGLTMFSSTVKAQNSEFGNKEFQSMTQESIEGIREIVLASDLLNKKIFAFRTSQVRQEGVQPIKLNEVNRFEALLNEYLALRSDLSRILIPYRFLAEQKLTMEYSLKRKSFLNEYLETETSGNPNESNWRYAMRLNPKDKLGRELIKTIEAALVGAMHLFDNYNNLIQPVMDNSQWRIVIKRDFSDEIGQLNDPKDGFVDHINRDRLLRLIEIYGQYLNETSDELKINSDFSYSIQESAIYSKLFKEGFPAFAHAIKYFRRSVGDGFSNLLNSTGFVGSQIFGNIMGLVQFRSGKLNSLPPEEKKNIKESLKPLDILAEKTPARLTDKFIPGYFGHAAIYIGTEEQLRELGIWEHPEVQKYADQIREGNTILESVRIPGVRLNSLENFLDIDDLLVIRNRDISNEQKGLNILKALSHFGKKYDFNFDIETQRKIVCSELIYDVFDTTPWITEKIFGRYTISPDNIAEEVLKPNSEFDLILFYKDGAKVSLNEGLGALKQALKLEKKKLADLKKHSQITND